MPVPKEKHVDNNFDQKNDESKEEDQFWDELEEFYLNLDDRPTFPKLEVSNQSHRHPYRRQHLRRRLWILVCQR